MESKRTTGPGTGGDWDEVGHREESRGGPDRPGPLRALLVIGLGLMVAFAFWRTSVGPGIVGSAPGPGVGREAGFNWQVVDLRGQPVDLSDYRGRAVFLNVWATWCPPCRAEFPSIVRLSEDPRVRDVAFLCISVDDSIDPVRRFAERQGGDRLEILVAAGPTPASLATQGIPATFLVAPDGTIAESRIGAEEWDSPEVIERLATLARMAAD